MLKATILGGIGAVLIAAGILAYLVVLGASLLRKELDHDAAPVSDGTALEYARARGPALAAAPARDVVIGTDITRAERNARVAAFQRRETAERQARGFTSRGF